MKHPAQFGGDYSRQFDFFTGGLGFGSTGYGPVNSSERGYGGSPDTPYEPLTNINPSPAVKPGESTFPTGSSNHSGIPQDPTGEFYLGDDDRDLTPDDVDDDAQVVVGEDEAEEVADLEDEARAEAVSDLEDEEVDADEDLNETEGLNHNADGSKDNRYSPSQGDVGEPV